MHSLKTKTENYAKERQLCEDMDPDGPIRTKRPIHDLDVEDENRLFRYIFQLLLCGQLQDGKDIAQRLGLKIESRFLYIFIFFEINIYVKAIFGCRQHWTVGFYITTRTIPMI